MIFLRFSKRVGDGDPAAVGIVAVFRAGQVAYSQSGVFGRRVSRTVGSTTIRYIYDGQQVFAELDGSENLDAVYTYYPGIDRPHMMERGGSRYYYGFDVPGNVLGLFDGTGIVNKYIHTPFGQADTTSHTVTNPYRYMSRRYDEESGLYFMRARYYDPDLARFVSEDPIGLMGGINVYAFAGNDPANSRDPLGLCEETDDDHECYYLDGLTVTVGKKDGAWQAMAEAMFWAATMFYDVGGTAGQIGFTMGGGGGTTNLDRTVEAWQRIPPACRVAAGRLAGSVAMDGLFFTGVGAPASVGLRAAASGAGQVATGLGVASLRVVGQRTFYRAGATVVEGGTAVTVGLGATAYGLTSPPRIGSAVGSLGTEPRWITFGRILPVSGSFINLYDLATC